MASEAPASHRQAGHMTAIAKESSSHKVLAKRGRPHMVRVEQPIARCGEGSRESHGGEIAERRVWALLVVGGDPTRSAERAWSRS